MFKALMFVVALAGASAALAAPRETLLVTPAWLAANASDQNLVVLQVGDKAEYDAGHIPGARFVAMDTLSVTGPAPASLVLEMPSPDDLEKRLEQLGISDGSKVVVSYSRNQLPAATRVIFTLAAAGLGDKAALLDGGLEAWRSGGHPLTDQAPPAKVGALSPLRMQPLVADADAVRTAASSPRHVVIDARAKAFYDGAQAGRSGGQAQPAGRVQGARSLPFSSISNADGTIKSADELAAAFKAAGVEEGDTVVAYCHVGQQATAVFYAAQLLGIKAQVYDGSYQEWSQRGLPVEGPAAAAP